MMDQETCREVVRVFERHLPQVANGARKRAQIAGVVGTLRERAYASGMVDPFEEFYDRLRGISGEGQ